MSKQSEAKEKQGFQVKPCVCGDCRHFTSDKEEVNHGFGFYTKERNLRCSKGGFKVGKSNTCREWGATEPKW